MGLGPLGGTNLYWVRAGLGEGSSPGSGVGLRHGLQGDPECPGYARLNIKRVKFAHASMIPPVSPSLLLAILTLEQTLLA
jgi:hypothetical protein